MLRFGGGTMFWLTISIVVQYVIVKKTSDLSTKNSLLSSHTRLQLRSEKITINTQYFNTNTCLISIGVARWMYKIKLSRKSSQFINYSCGRAAPRNQKFVWDRNTIRMGGKENCWSRYTKRITCVNWELCLFSHLTTSIQAYVGLPRRNYRLHQFVHSFSTLHEFTERFAYGVTDTFVNSY